MKATTWIQGYNDQKLIALNQVEKSARIGIVEHLSMAADLYFPSVARVKANMEKLIEQWPGDKKTKALERLEQYINAVGARLKLFLRRLVFLSH